MVATSCTSAVLADTTQPPDFDVALSAVVGTIVNGCERDALTTHIMQPQNARNLILTCKQGNERACVTTHLAAPDLVQPFGAATASHLVLPLHMRYLPTLCAVLADTKQHSLPTLHKTLWAVC